MQWNCKFLLSEMFAVKSQSCVPTWTGLVWSRTRTKCVQYVSTLHLCALEEKLEKCESNVKSRVTSACQTYTSLVRVLHFNSKEGVQKWTHSVFFFYMLKHCLVRSPEKRVCRVCAVLWQPNKISWCKKKIGHYSCCRKWPYRLYSWCKK